jgi:hypothetical protein
VDVPKEVPADSDNDAEIEQLKRDLKFWMLRADRYEKTMYEIQDALDNRHKG